MAGNITWDRWGVEIFLEYDSRRTLRLGTEGRVTQRRVPIGVFAKLMSEAEMTKHRQSEQSKDGVSRRNLVQALAAGAAASSLATPSSAQQMAVLAEATSADYVRDPTRWGSAE